MSQSEEVLLTKSQIVDIKKASADPLLKDDRFAHGIGGNKTTICRVSSQAELILIKGDEYTGMIHINSRHSYYAPRNWQLKTATESSSMRLDDPSRFRRTLIPVSDYTVIAETIYLHGSLDVQGNNRPDIFDKYIGDFTYDDGIKERHVLILYKDAKIIHTLFPHKSINNQKLLKSFPFKRGKVVSDTYLATGITEIKIPYFNHNNLLKYAVVIQIDPDALTQEILLWAYSEKGEPEQSIRIASKSQEGLEKPVDMFDLHHLQYADLRHFEQAIKDTESGKIQRLSDLS